MPRATCRCGQILNVPTDGSDRVVCSKCGARVRIRFQQPEDATRTADGFIRFFCPCGRRLKVPAQNSPSHGKCPDCQRVLPVPSRTTSALPPGHPEAETVDLNPTQQAALQRWAQRHGVDTASRDDDPELTPPIRSPHPAATTTVERAEAGLRVCPICHKPIHLGASACRACNADVPRP